MMMIDFHAHVFPDELAPKAMEVLLQQAPGVAAATNGTLTDLCRSMRQSGISKSLTLPVATKPSQVKHINRGCEAQKSPDIVPFGSLHPLQSDISQEIEFLKRHAILGVKLHPEYQDFYIDDKSMFPMYEMLADAGLITVFHTGKDPGPFTCDHALPLAIRRVHQEFPQLKMVAAHMGGWRLWDEAEEILCGLPIYFDTSAISELMNPDQFLRMVRKHGADYVLFGSDSPWFDQRLALDWVTESRLSDIEKEKIVSSNAHQLLYGVPFEE